MASFPSCGGGRRRCEVCQESVCLPVLGLHCGEEGLSVESKTEGGGVNWEVKVIEAACFKPTVEHPQDGQKFLPEILTNKLSQYDQSHLCPRVRCQRQYTEGHAPTCGFQEKCKVPKGIIARL